MSESGEDRILSIKGGSGVSVGTQDEITRELSTELTRGVECNIDCEKSDEPTESD